MGEPTDGSPAGDDDESTAAYRAGRRFLEVGDFAEAAHCFELSCQKRPHFKTLELLGECYMRLNRHAEAIVPLAAATTLSRQFRAPTLLAECFLVMDDLPAAERAVEIALSVNSSYRRAQVVRNRILKAMSDRGDNS